MLFVRRKINKGSGDVLKNIILVNLIITKTYKSFVIYEFSDNLKGRKRTKIANIISSIKIILSIEGS